MSQLITYGGVNGVGVSVIDIYDDDGLGNPGSFLRKITFHQCTVGGRTDRYILKQKRHELWNYAIATRNDGMMIEFELGFDDLSLVENTLKIGNDLMQNILQNKHLLLTPRADLNLIRYEVIPASDFEIEMQSLFGGTASIGNKISGLKFITKFPTKNINWYSPALLLFGVDPDNYTII